MLQEQFKQDLFDNLLVELPFDTDSETFTRVLIDHAQHAEDLSIMCSVLHVVIRPDMAFVLRAQPDARTVIEPKPHALVVSLALSALHVSRYDTLASR